MNSVRNRILRKRLNCRRAKKTKLVAIGIGSRVLNHEGNQRLKRANKVIAYKEKQLELRLKR